MDCANLGFLVLGETMKVYISSSDSVLHVLYDDKYCSEYFGGDFLEEWGTEFPEELYLEYEEVNNKFMFVQEKISKFLKENK